MNFKINKKIEIEFFLKSKIHTLLFYLCTKFKMMILIEPVKNPIFILFRLHNLMWKSCYNLINYFSWSSLHCIAVLGRCIILYSNALPFHGFKSLLKRMKCTLVERNLECKTVAFFSSIFWHSIWKFNPENGFGNFKNHWLCKKYVVLFLTISS